MDIELYKVFFKALSNRTRFEIIKLLRESGPKSVSEICEELGFEQSRVSHNLKCLVACGFLDVEERGRLRVYYLDQNLAEMMDLLDEHLRRYGDKLRKCEILKGKLTCRWAKL